jgi:hypothetical protein
MDYTVKYIYISLLSSKSLFQCPKDKIWYTLTYHNKPKPRDPQCDSEAPIQTSQRLYDFLIKYGVK